MLCVASARSIVHSREYDEPSELAGQNGLVGVGRSSRRAHNTGATQPVFFGVELFFTCFYCR